MFAGVLAPGSEPMRCSDGRCTPRWPLKLEVTALASSGVDGAGVPTTLPQAQLAQGSCLLEEGEASCLAVANGWRRQARMRW